MQTPARAPAAPRLIDRTSADPAAVRLELLAGLAAPQAHASPKYLYDTLGARLFEAITELPEYYPTRAERAIFDAHADEMAAGAGTGLTMVDLGAGNCEKAARLFPALRPQRYVAIDIAADFLDSALAALKARFPALDMLGIGMDFSSALTLPPEAGPGPRLLFYPGSSIGNFDPDAALAFLRQARAACAGGSLLIGVDLVKDRAILEPAYDDALQVTAAFNRNLLLHFNRLAGTDFALADWAHRAFFNAGASRIEMHLEALRDLAVRWPGGERRFARGATIHTENSYKWTRPAFAALLAEAGYSAPRCWTDPRGWFAVFLARA